MAPLASMVARVARDASTRSRFVLPAAAAAAVSRAACSPNLILGSRLFAALGPQINIIGGASESKRQLFGCAKHGTRRPLCTNSSGGFNEQPNNSYRDPDEFVAEEKDIEEQPNNNYRDPDELVAEKDIEDQPGYRCIEFVAEEEDMESEEALWALYHRWCKHHNIQRDHDDMVRRFDEFKYCVREVHRVNNSGESIRLTLNKYSDTPLSEFVPKRPVISQKGYERLKALGGFTIEFGPRTDY